MAEDLEARLFAMAHKALAHWDLDVAGIELASRSENVVFKLTTRSGEHYALRIHRPGYNTLEELNSELAWADALREAGVNVPRHVRARDGRGYATLALEGGEQRHHAGIIGWFNGELLAGLIKTAKGSDLFHYFEQLGDLIARIHNQATGWTLPEHFTRRAWDANGLVGDTPLWGRFWELPELDGKQSELLYAAKEAIHDRLLALGQSAETYSLTHADLHPQNILVDKGRVQVIDFDDAGFGWHHYELAVALYDYRYQDNFPDLLNALVRGYRGLRELPQETVDRLPLFSLIRSLVLVGWLNDRRDLGHAQWIPTQVRVACGEAKAFLDG